MHLLSDLFIEEYQTLVADLGPDLTPDQLITTLILHADWTPEGAATLLHLAQAYGTFVLRNALALAHALDIEDGESGL